MKIGAFEIHPLETGTFALDGGSMFGIIPYQFWSKTNPPDDRFRITLAARSLLLTGNGKVILIDTGNGTKFSEKQKDIYRLDNTKHDLLSSLRAHGIGPDDVTDVVLIHLHFDHCGGCTAIEQGNIVPVFGNAIHYVQRAHWNLSQNPTERDRASFMKDDFMVLNERGLLQLVDGEKELLPGIEVLVCNGHTASQQLPLISDGNRKLLFCCDLIPTASHVPLPSIMGFDLQPLVTLTEKKWILPRAHQEGWVLYLQHDPLIEAITLKESDKGYSVDQKIRIDEAKR